MKSLLAHLSVIDESIGGCRRILIACDYDGTLAPIAATPDAASLPTATVATLHRLSATVGVQVAVVSGRSLEDLRRRVQLPVILAGNHGLEIKGPNWSFEHKHAIATEPILQRFCSSVAAILPSFPGAVLENKHLTATVHYRLAPEHLHAPLLRAVRGLMGDYAAHLSLRSGKMAIEIHPKLTWNKGSALALIRLRAGLACAPCICFGDDRTDEWMFRRFEDGISVIVGERTSTSARFRLQEPAEVAAVLNYIADMFTDYTPCTHFTRHVIAREAILSRGR